MPATITEEIRAYLRERSRPGPGGCRIWAGALDRDGYGICAYGRAHRVAYRVFVGEIPTGKLVLHTRACRSRACIEPRHLYLGTQKQNIADMDALGRRIGNVKLSKAQIAAILASTTSIPALARRYRVSHTQIWRILRRLSWGAASAALPGAPRRRLRARLTPQQVRRIRRLGGSTTHQAIADQIGCYRVAVTDVLNGRSYRNIR